MTHGRDARERLTTEPERSNRAEILRTRDLARRMTFDRQPGVLGLHPFPIVLDAEQLLSAQLDRHRDARRVGIERVLDQFLDDRGGAFDDFAGGDLVSEMKGKAVDTRHDEC